MSETHFIGNIAQKALIVRDGSILVVRGPHNKMFELPGGRLNKGEQPGEGILREIKEELGVKTKIESVFSIKTVYHKDTNEAMIIIYYILSLVEDDQDFIPDPSEIVEMQWADEEFEENYSLFPSFNEILKDYFNKVVL